MALVLLSWKLLTWRFVRRSITAPLFPQTCRASDTSSGKEPLIDGKSRNRAAHGAVALGAVALGLALFASKFWVTRVEEPKSLAYAAQLVSVTATR